MDTHLVPVLVPVQKELGLVVTDVGGERGEPHMNAVIPVMDAKG